MDRRRTLTKPQNTAFKPSFVILRLPILLTTSLAGYRTRCVDLKAAVPCPYGSKRGDRVARSICGGGEVCGPDVTGGGTKTGGEGNDGKFEDGTDVIVRRRHGVSGRSLDFA